MTAGQLPRCSDNPDHHVRGATGEDKTAKVLSQAGPGSGSAVYCIPQGVFLLPASHAATPGSRGQSLPSEPSEPYSPGKDSLCFRVRALLSMQWVEHTSVTRQHKLLHLKHIPTQNDYVMLQHDYGQDLHVQRDSLKMRKETENHCCC